MERGAEPAGERDWVDVGLIAAAVVLTLATAYIHFTLGTLLFLMTALGYTVAAVALVIPLGIARRFRWLVRLGLLGYTLFTIVGWIFIGARYDVAYIDKAIEVVLVGVLLASIVRFDGGVSGVLQHLRALPAELADLVRGR